MLQVYEGTPLVLCVYVFVNHEATLLALVHAGDMLC